MVNIICIGRNPFESVSGYQSLKVYLYKTVGTAHRERRKSPENPLKIQLAKKCIHRRRTSLISFRVNWKSISLHESSFCKLIMNFIKCGHQP